MVRITEHKTISRNYPCGTTFTRHAPIQTSAMNDVGVLPGFTGAAGHDAWSPYDTDTATGQAPCNPDRTHAALARRVHKRATDDLKFAHPPPRHPFANNPP